MNTSILDVIVIGAGQAGLGASYYLKKYGLTHVVFDRGRIGESWRSQRWDSFQLNSSNKLNTLPGGGYTGNDPDGFSTARQFADTLQTYAATYSLPVVENATIVSVDKNEATDIFHVIVLENKSLKNYYSRQVIAASGAQNEVKLPSFATSISGDVRQLHTANYRNPDQLPPGTVLVVGSAQSGCQVAQDLACAGRKVYLSTSMVPRVPRRYRGKDIMDWLLEMGFFDARPEQVTDPQHLHLKAPQLTGTGGGRHTISLQGLAKEGVVIIGKMEKANEANAYFNPDAAMHVQFADGFSKNVKEMIDEFIKNTYVPAPLPAPEEADKPDVNASCASDISVLNFKKHHITSVIWNTGFTGNFKYIKLPVFDAEGFPKHQEGTSTVRGLYFLGLPWLRSRKSFLINGAKDDAEAIVKNVYQASQQIGAAITNS